MNIFHSEIRVSSFLSLLDITLIIFFVFIFILSPKLIARFGSRALTQNEYLLMNRGLTLPLFVATLTSTWYGGIFGVTQIAFEHGLYSFFTQGISWYSAYFIFAFFLAKKIRREKVQSLPELIGQRFGTTARSITGFILFFHALPVSYAVSLGIIIQILTGLSFGISVIIGVTLVASYSISGGLRAIVITDSMQFILMFLGVVMIALFSFFTFGGYEFLSQTLPAHYFDWQGDKGSIALLVWFLTACSSTLIHPVFYQRCLAAKTDNTALIGIIIAILFWILFDCCTTLGGMYAKAVIPDAASDKAYLFYGLQLLPNGLRGLFVVGIISTILSTLDSFLFVSGTSISYDFLRGDSPSIKKHQIMIAISALLTITVSCMFQADFEAMWLFMEGIFSSALLLPTLIALNYQNTLTSRNFFIPVMASLGMYCLITIANITGLSSWTPLFLAQGCAILSFMVVLYTHTKSNTKKTIFAK